MIAFTLISSLLLVGALAFIGVPLVLRKRRGAPSRAAVNLSIHRDELRELDAAREVGSVDVEQYETARREIEARLLDDLGGGAAQPKASARPRSAVLVAGVAIPLVAVALYAYVGNPQAIGGAQVGEHQLAPLVERLAARMSAQPDDAQGWILLARSYQALGRSRDSAEAYARAIKLVPGDAQLLADYADSLAMAQGGRLQGEPEKIVARALQAEPDNLKALALAGTVAFERQDYNGAVRHWQRIAALVPPGSETGRAVLASIAEARSLAGSPEPPQRLGRLELEHALRGNEALAQIDRLHGKSIGAQRGYVAHYGKGDGVAMLYEAEASSEQEAASQLEQMRARIRRGDTPFSQLKSSKRGTTTLYSARGQGQVHYFYRREASVLWLAVDAPLATQALAALLTP